MQENIVQTESELDLQAYRQVQGLLSSVGIASALYRWTGDTPGAPLSAVGDACCGVWPNCVDQLLQNGESWLDITQPTPSHCPQGYLAVTIPVHQRREMVGVLLCCLKSLRFDKTEQWQRLCSRLGIDSSFLAGHGLRDAIGGTDLAEILQTILPQLLEKSQRCHENKTEMQALSTSLAQTYEEVTLLQRISEGMKVTQKPQTFFAQLCRDLREVVDARKVLILWRGSEGPAPTVEMVDAGGEPPVAQSMVDLLWRRTEQQSEGPQEVLIDSNVDGPYTYQWPEEIDNVVSIPVRRDEKQLGALVALNKINKPDFDSSDTKLMISVANECGVYLENFRLYDDLQDLLMGSLRALTRSIEAKDPYTCGHSERVAVVSRRLAEQLSLTTPEVDAVYLAGLLHDVGKIGVSEAVLCKPGRLLRDEFEQIKRHPAIGANILNGIKQMEQVNKVVLTHHERFDGHGYPQGLHSSNIPLTGRIMMLADAFDAMISHRIYKRAMPLKAAAAEIRRFSGTQFDPELAEVFLKADFAQVAEELDSIETDQPSLANLRGPALNRPA